MIKVNCEFTRHGNFAVWESGSYSSKTHNGWSVLVGSPEAKPLVTLFNRNPAQSRNHYLFKVDTGYLVVVTNVKPWTSGDLVTVKIVIGYFSNLVSKPTQGKANASQVEYSTKTLWSESLIAPKGQVVQRSADLSIDIEGYSSEIIARLKTMAKASVEKAMTLPEGQKCFYGTVRPLEQKAKAQEQTAVDLGPDSEAPDLDDVSVDAAAEEAVASADSSQEQ